MPNQAMIEQMRATIAANQPKKSTQNFTQVMGDMGKGYTPTQRDLQGSPFMSRWTQTGAPTDSAGRPLNPDFVSIGDESSGLLKQPYNSGSFLDDRGLNAIRKEALRDPGTMSRWGELARSEQMNQLARSQAGQFSQAQNQLAQSGGLRTGARERLASAGMQQNLAAQQRSLGGIQMQDESNRLNQLGQLPGADLAAANYQSGRQDTNINRALSEIAQKRALQQGQYNEAMRAWAAEKTGNAAPQTQDRGFLGNLFSGLF
jgi:hypothetical protein